MVGQRIGGIILLLLLGKSRMEVNGFFSRRTMCTYHHRYHGKATNTWKPSPIRKESHDDNNHHEQNDNQQQNDDSLLFLHKEDDKENKSPGPSYRFPSVWIQEAEKDFVEEDENLEEGEICLRAVKAFASPPPNDDSGPPRFLCAGALVQRPTSSSLSSSSSHTPHKICNAWTADSILDEGGPNLQYQGAVLVLLDLFLFHLQSYSDDLPDNQNPNIIIEALRTFVVKCGSTSSTNHDDDNDNDGGFNNEWTCASYMAAKQYGFRPLSEQIRVSSIYTTQAYYDYDLEGLVLDIPYAKNMYEQLLSTSLSGTLSETERGILTQIYKCFPDDDTIRRYTKKRFFTVPPNS